MIFYKLYLTFDLLGSLLGELDKTCVSRLIAKLEPIVQKKMKLPEIKRERRKPISSLDELITLYPEIVEVIGDATEQEIPRPKDKRKRKKFYSGKKKRHTIKTQILIERNNGQILEASLVAPGSIHDYKLFLKSRLAQRLPEKIPIHLFTSHFKNALLKDTDKARDEFIDYLNNTRFPYSFLGISAKLNTFSILPLA